MVALGELGSMQHWTKPVFTERVGGRTHICNGLEPRLRFDRRTKQLEFAGLLAPTATPPPAVRAGGQLTGTYQYVVSEYDTIHDIESDPGPPQEIIASGELVDFAPGIWYAPRNAATTHFRVYRGVAGISFVTPDEAVANDNITVIPMARVLEVPVGTGDTYTDNYSDDELKERMYDFPLSFFRAFPPTFTYPVLCRGRLFGWGRKGYGDGLVDVRNGSRYIFPDDNTLWNSGIIGQRIQVGSDNDSYIVEDFLDSSPLSIEIDQPYRGETANGQIYHTWPDDGRLVWSEDSEPESMPNSNELFVAKGQGLKETGIGEIRGFPVLFFSTQTWLLQYGDNPGSRSMRQLFRLSSSVGTIGHNTIAKINRGSAELLVWLSRYGIATTGGQGVEIVSDPPIYPGGLRDYFDNMSLDSQGKAEVACAVNYEPEGLYICAFPTDKSRGGCDEVVVWDYRKNNFWRWKFKFEIYAMEIVWKFVSDPDDAAIIRFKPVVAMATSDGYTMYWPAGENDGGSREDAEGTLEGTITGVGDNYIDDDDAAFMTESAESPSLLKGLEGAYVTIQRASDGAYQHILIKQNDATRMEFNAFPNWVPTVGDSYWIGEIENYYRSPRMDFGSLLDVKEINEMHLVYDIEDGGILEFQCWNDQIDDPVSLDDGSTVDLSAVQDNILKRTLTDNQKGRQKIPINSVAYHWQFQIGNRKPNQPWTVKAASINFGRRTD